MSVDWDEPSTRDGSFAGPCQQTPGLLSRRPPAPTEAEAQVMFECAAADAAIGYVETLAQLQEAQERIKKLEAQLAALIGIGN